MKQYNNEKAIISLTSWKKRIKTVSRTIFSLQKQCPGFHIVLVLSEDEFPKKEEELPEDLLLFLDTNIFELLWVKKNYKAFKKWLFTAQKYQNVPIIAADDDCIYKYNYANELYTTWLAHKNCVISYSNTKWCNILCTWGCATLYPPNYFKDVGIKFLTDEVIATLLDDNYYMVLRKKLKLFDCIHIKKNIRCVMQAYNEISPLHAIYNRSNMHQRTYNILDKLIKI